MLTVVHDAESSNDNSGGPGRSLLDDIVRDGARKMLAAMREPFELGDRQVARIGATIGIAMAPDNGSEAGALLRAADEAMYAGKTAGRQCIRQAGRVAEPILV